MTDIVTNIQGETAGSIISVSAAIYVSADDSLIDCVVTTAAGAMPFTANKNDVEAHGRDLYSDLVAGKYGAIQPFTPPK